MAKLDIQNVNARSFILSTKTFLRTVCSLRYSVKKLNFLITFFLETPCTNILLDYKNIHLNLELVFYILSNVPRYLS